MDKTATTREPIHALLAARWSPRAMDPDKPVSRSDLTSLLEAARWAPSCFGDEPWRYLVFDRSRDEAGWRRAFDCLSEGNRAWVCNAPIILASCADSRFRNNDKPNRWGQHDTGAASENLCLQAAALGLVAHQMGGFDREALAGAFAIPQRYTPMAMIAVGHPGDPSDLPASKREQELGPRRRQPLEEMVFEGGWSEAYDFD